MNGYSLITEKQLAARMHVSARTISRVLAIYGDSLGEKHGVFRFSRRTLRFNPDLAVAALSKAYRESHAADRRDVAGATPSVRP